MNQYPQQGYPQGYMPQGAPYPPQGPPYPPPQGYPQGPYPQGAPYPPGPQGPYPSQGYPQQGYAPQPQPSNNPYANATGPMQPHQQGGVSPRPGYEQSSSQPITSPTSSSSSSPAPSPRNRELDKPEPMQVDSEPVSNDKGDEGEKGCLSGLFSSSENGPRQLTSLEKLILFAQVAMAAVTIIMSILSYTSWSLHKDALDDWHDNWNAVPFSNFALMSASSCFAGYQYVGPAGAFEYEVTDNEGEKKDVTAYIMYWKNRGFCAARSGVSTLNRVHARRVNGVYVCPDNTYKLCGLDDCIPSNQDCPITSIQIYRGAHPDAPASMRWTHSGQTYSLLLHRNETGKRPLTNIGVNAQRNAKREYCYGMSMYSKLDLSCSIWDKRYVEIDAYDGSNGQIALFNDNNFPAAAVGESGASALLFTRNEITWSDSCSKSREEAYDESKPLGTISSMQLAVLIIAIIAGAMNFYLTWQVYKERTDDDAHNDDTSARRQFYCGVFTDFITLAITIAALAVAENVKGLLNLLNSELCSDETTNRVFVFFSNEIDTVNSYNIALLVIRGLWLLFRLIKCLFCNEKVGK